MEGDKDGNSGHTETLPNRWHNKDHTRNTGSRCTEDEIGKGHSRFDDFALAPQGNYVFILLRGTLR